MQFLIRAAIVLSTAAALGGCAVVTVAGTAVGLAATAASVTVDAAVGTAKVIGSAVTPGSSGD